MLQAQHAPLRAAKRLAKHAHGELGITRQQLGLPSLTPVAPGARSDDELADARYAPLPMRASGGYPDLLAAAESAVKLPQPGPAARGTAAGGAGHGPSPKQARGAKAAAAGSPLKRPAAAGSPQKAPAPAGAAGQIAHPRRWGAPGASPAKPREGAPAKRAPAAGSPQPARGDAAKAQRPDPGPKRGPAVSPPQPRVGSPAKRPFAGGSPLRLDLTGVGAGDSPPRKEGVPALLALVCPASLRPPLTCPADRQCLYAGPHTCDLAQETVVRPPPLCACRATDGQQALLSKILSQLERVERLLCKRAHPAGHVPGGLGR